MARHKERIFDAYLVASARLGDREALGTLVERWNGKLLAHAWRLLRDREGAQDAVQDGWAEMLRGLSRLRDDSAFPAWAYRIVSRRCARQIGRLRADRRLIEEVESESLGEPASASAAMDAEPAAAAMDAEALQRAIGGLSAAQQVALALFYGEDMSVAEVAVALDVPAGTVKTRLMHARHKLRGVLQGDE